MPEHDASVSQEEEIVDHQKPPTVSHDYVEFVCTETQELFTYEAFQGDEESHDEADEIWDVFLLDEEYEPFPEEGDFDF